MTPAINLTDGYKVDHRRQMPEEAIYQLNNFTPRKTRRKNMDRIVFFGLQYFIRKYIIQQFDDTFFKLPKEVVVQKYMRRINNYLGPGHRVTPFHIEKLHDLGFMPIRIKALPEGSLVNIKVPPVTIESTMGKEYVWLVGYLESLFSNIIWGPCTSATTAFEYRRILDKYAMLTVGHTNGVEFQGHDFSFRGMFGVEAAEMSGAAHLLSFVGTDTIPAIDFLEDWYYADSDRELIGCSVAATEHSVMCTGTGVYIYDQFDGDWTRIGDAEKAVFKRLITEVYPDGIVSIVSDTFDLWQVCTQYLVELKDEVMARDGKIVIRPDSGDPVEILCGLEFDILDSVYEIKTHYGDQVWDDCDEYITSDGYQDKDVFFCKVGEQHFEVQADLRVQRERGGYSDNNYYCLDEVTVTYKEITPTPAQKGVVELLWDAFGGTVTEKGYRLLDSHIGTIYGDSITTERCINICERLMTKGYASTNWVAGIGSYTYQYVTRDTDGWAMKATFVKADLKGKIVDIDIFKDPITDDGTKKSARGRPKVVRHQKDNQITNRPEQEWFELEDQVSEEDYNKTCLETVFVDGRLTRTQSLANIRYTLQRAGRLM